MKNVNHVVLPLHCNGKPTGSNCLKPKSKQILYIGALHGSTASKQGRPYCSIVGDTIMVSLISMSFLWGHPDVPQSLCSPISMFPGPMFPSTYGSQSLCSPVLYSPIPMFPSPMFPGPYAPQSLCSPVPMYPIPMLPGTYLPEFFWGVGEGGMRSVGTSC